MNIGFNLSRKVSGTLVVVSFASLAATTALAGPNQLDILGLIPGESDLTQVKQASVDPNSNSDTTFQFEIGGHKIPCTTSFRNGKLDSLFCLTGKGAAKYAQYTDASNTEVHSTLTAGFTKKFGKPDSVAREVVRTRMGVEHEQQFVIWKDKQGNKLQLISMADTVNMGVITFESFEYLKELGKVLHGRLQESKIRRREVSKGLQSYIRPVVAGFSSCWPGWHSRAGFLSAHRA